MSETEIIETFFWILPYAIITATLWTVTWRAIKGRNKNI